MSIRRFSAPVKFAATLAFAATGGLVLAQVDTPQPAQAPSNPSSGPAAGQPAVPSGNPPAILPANPYADVSGNYEVTGIDVDVIGKTADAARYAGWRIAQRKGWDMLARRMGHSEGGLSDGALDGLVSGIVIENEQIGPNRYVGKLGILFSRARAGAILGVAAEASRSAPMLTIPIEVSGGVATGFEQKTAWQDAWTRYRTGNSAIDYVRPSGTGADAMLLNLGQTERPGRGWWRVVLDQYGATDILVPKVTLRREWPGGPIIGAFEARHGPDNQLIAQFTLRVDRADALPVLLDAGVKRMDDAYQTALSNGRLSGDSGLTYVAPVVTPTPIATPTDVVPIDLGLDGMSGPTAARVASFVTVQVDTPSAASVTATEGALQAVPGVRSAITTSLAIGGVSVMRVAYDADPAVLRAALEARGWSVGASGSTLRIRRSGQPSGGQALPPAENSTG